MLTNGNNNIYIGSQGGGRRVADDPCRRGADQRVHGGHQQRWSEWPGSGRGRERAARRDALISPLQSGHRADRHTERWCAGARLVTFAYREDAQHVKHYGLIAEEVAAVYLELV